ncbi:DUF4349 domain-containing protein [Lacisediminihabitans changchengi]|uniref:DUF4349 domain-containing protein n=1 Tax=Lacisediminihabitans changchengi TaxID=2787634 RepID=A0A934W457_9MICO|nr:DUF4349 domain-containing protein [Lacisediminihabitans changchengi]MBK4347160.1 DUF4349 domain-containing protein [Lacisediminihabitans changchengi]
MTQRRTSPALVVALTVGLVLTASLTGCVSSGSSESRGSDSAPSIADSSVPRTGTVAEGSDTAASSGTTKPATAGRDVVSTGTVSLTVKKPTDAATRAVRIVETAGGRVDDRTERAATKGDHGSASLTLRIPSAALTETLASIRALGKVDDVSISARDVTAEHTDLGARVTALRASVDRLVDLMSRSATTADLITIESALSQRQSDLEALEAQQAALGNQIALATITLRLGSIAPAPPAPAPADFLSGLTTGWNALVTFITGVIVVVGVLLPWVLPPAAVAAIVLLVLRRRHRAVLS